MDDTYVFVGHRHLGRTATGNYLLRVLKRGCRGCVRDEKAMAQSAVATEIGGLVYCLL